MQEYTLLSHLLELLTKWEWHLCNDETLKDCANGLEDHYIQHALNILLNHITDHIWVGHHLGHLVELYLLFKVTSVFCTEVRLPLLHTLLWKIIGILSDTARAHHSTSMLQFLLNLFERCLDIHKIILVSGLHLFAHVRLVLQNGIT